MPHPRAAAVFALLLAALPAAAQAPAESPPITIRSLEADSGDARAEVRIGCDRKPVWTARAEGDLELVLWLAAGVPGPAVRDLELPAGLIATVRVGPGEGTAAGTRIAIGTRRPVGSSTDWSDGRLTVVLKPLAGGRSRIEPDDPQLLPADGTRRTVTASPCLKLRRAPATSARAIECLPTGTPLAGLAEDRDWTRVRLADGRVGWVASQYLSAERTPAAESPEPARVATPAPAEPLPAAPAPEASAPAPRAAQDSRIASLESRVAELSRERDELRGRIDALEAAARAGEASAAQAERLQAQLDRVSSERDELRQRVEAVEKSAAAAEASAAQAERLQAQLDRVSSERDDLRRRVEAMNQSLTAGEASAARAARLQQQLDQVSAERDDLRRRAEAMNESLAAGEASADRAARLQRQLEEVSAERDELRRRVGQLEDAARAAESAASAEARRLRAELASVGADRDALRRRLQALEETAAPARSAEAPREEGGVLVRPPLAHRPPAVARPPLAAAQPADRAEVAAAVAAWADAWAGQRVDDYLAFYAPDFRPPDGLDRSAWEAQRRLRLTRPRSIEVEVRDLVVRIDGPERAEARFAQSYRSDIFSDRVTKVLEMGRRGGVWQILAERTEP